MIISSPHKPHTDAEVTEDNAEARMRQALGKLGTARPGKPEPPRRTTYQVKARGGRHRFKQDGEVPVGRLTLAPSNRTGERQPISPVGTVSAVQVKAGERREQGGADSVRQVQELTEQLRATQTRLGHAELALGEASRTARERQEETASLSQALDGLKASLAQVRAELAASQRAREELERRREAAWPSRLEADEREGAVTRRKVGRPLGSNNRVRDQRPASEPEPVRWWAGD